MKWAEAATGTPAVRPRQKGTCCRPKIGSKGQLSFRNEARRKARHPEVQHLLLPGGREGHSWSSLQQPLSKTTYLYSCPLRGISSGFHTSWKMPVPWWRSEHFWEGPGPQAKLLQEYPLFHQLICSCSAKATWTDGIFQRQPLPQTFECWLSP